MECFVYSSEVQSQASEVLVILVVSCMFILVSSLPGLLGYLVEKMKSSIGSKQALAAQMREKL